MRPLLRRCRLKMWLGVSGCHFGCWLCNIILCSKHDILSARFVVENNKCEIRIMLTSLLEVLRQSSAIWVRKWTTFHKEWETKKIVNSDKGRGLNFRLRTVEFPLLMHTHFFENHYHCECDNHKNGVCCFAKFLEQKRNVSKTEKMPLFSGSC